ncbi:MAG TPA: GAF domain-containing protein [Lamprocystis sp. (in: g-proteobacteria)]|nr:GAF domain-containing protein [Lamprocystis sp. (in: g-proteobacteria)]
MPDPFDLSLLDACEQERLDRIGAIQPFGVLLGGDVGDQRIRVASADAASWLGVPGNGVLNRPLSALLPISLGDFPAEPGQKRILPGLVETPRGWLDAVLCNTGTEWLLELEPLGTDDPAQPLLSPLLGRLLRAPLSELELEHYASALADVVRHTTQYQRTLVYRFLPDDCGEVMAESSADPVPRYLGLRFPASDIPKIARDLYRINHHRQIPNVAAMPVPILSSLPGREADLTLSDLRAVSPVHLEYLRNMEVAGSLSFSILVGGALWGLVACHHRTPRFLSVRVRGRCVELTQQFALGIGSFLVNQRLDRVTGMEDRLAALAERLPDGHPELPPMPLVGPPMLDLFKADGVAVVDGRGVHTFGATPVESEIQGIDRWLLDQGGNQVFATDHLAEESGLGANPALASGVLMVPARANRPAEPGRRLYWFRPEQPHTVHWAGNPVKPMGVDPATGILSPRRSFDLWVKTTRGCSEPWNELDLMGARMLRLILLRGGPGPV